MTRPSNILISTVLRNQRFRGSTSSAQQNDFQNETIRDSSAFQKQWNELIVPFSQRLPDGTLDTSVNAFKDGLDGRTLFVNSDADINTGTGQYYVNALSRPTTTYEQFIDVYNAIDVAVQNLESLIQAGGSGGLSLEEQASIGINIFNSSLESSPTSLDGITQTNQLNLSQLAKDLYGAAGASFSSDGAAILTNSNKAMVDALLELHGGNWDNDIGLVHTFSADDITGGSLSQEVVEASSSSGTGVNDSYTGTPSNLVEDLNQVRTLFRDLKDNSISFSSPLSLSGTWTPLSVPPTDFKLLTNLIGSGTRSDSNPWGYDYSNIDGLTTRLTAEQVYTGRDNLTDSTPTYSDVLNFVQGDSLTTAVGGLAGRGILAAADDLALGALFSGHNSNTSNPHSTDLSQVSLTGGFAPAGQITIVDSGTNFTSVFVEGALQELSDSIATTASDITAVSGLLQTDITTVSGLLQTDIIAVSGLLQTDLTTVSGVLQTQIDNIPLGIVITISGDQVLTSVATKAFVDASSADVKLDLAPALASNGNSFTVKKTDATVNTVTVSGTDLIDGAGSQTLASQYDSITMVSNGITYYII